MSTHSLLRKRCAFYLLLCLHPILAHAQNRVEHHEHGIIYQLEMPLYVYAPEDRIDVSYQIFNTIHKEIHITTADGRLSEFELSTADTTITMPYGTIDAETDWRIQQGKKEYGGAVAHFAKLLTVTDGDTLTIQGWPMSEEYVAGMIYADDKQANLYNTKSAFTRAFNSTLEELDPYYKRYDLNQDNIINLIDWLLWATGKTDRRTIPTEARLSLTFYVRVKSADIDRNGQINEHDIETLRKSFGAKIGDTKYSIYADLNGDGQIDFKDFREFLAIY